MRHSVSEFMHKWLRIIMILCVFYLFAFSLFSIHALLPSGISGEYEDTLDFERSNDGFRYDWIEGVALSADGSALLALGVLVLALLILVSLRLFDRSYPGRHVSDSPIRRGTTIGWWPWIILVLSTIYLMVEFVFNATLLDTASSLDLDNDALHQAELFGRSVSGAGFALLVLGVLVKLRFRLVGKWQRLIGAGFVGICLIPFSLNLDAPYPTLGGVVGVSGLVAYFAATRPNARPAPLILISTLIMAWTAMFAGQKILIERFLIEPSDWETRLTAQYMTLLKTGLSRNLIEIDGAPFDATRRDEPEERTFIALVGALVMRTPEFLQLARSQEQPIIQEITRQMGQEDIARHYARYREEGDRFQAIWRSYQEGSKAYAQTVNRAPAEAQKQYADLLNQLESDYREYQKASDRHHGKMREAAETLSSDLKRYFDQRARCKSQRCIDSADRDYSRRTTRFFGKEVPLETWCRQREAKAIESLEDGINTVLRAPFSALGKALGNDTLGYQAPNRFECDTSVNAVAFKVTQITGDKFEIKSGGYPLGLDRAAFFDHQVTTSRLTRELPSKGIDLPANWRVSNAKSYTRAVQTTIREKAKAKWKSDVQDILGGYVKPNLGYAKLLQQPAAQERLRDSMGEFYAKGMTLEYSEVEFQNRVLEPAVAREVKERLNILRTQGESYANGASREEEGKQFLRAVLIPPISLFLSLFFALITTGKSLVMLGAMLAERSFLQQHPGIMRGFVMVSWGIVLGAVMSIPLLVPNKFADAAAFRYFAEHARSTAPALTAMTEWTIRMQPVMYPVGNRIKTLVPGSGGINLALFLPPYPDFIQ